MYTPFLYLVRSNTEEMFKLIGQVRAIPVTKSPAMSSDDKEGILCAANRAKQCGKKNLHQDGLTLLAITVLG